METRKNIRIKEYDYSKKGMYYITICCKEMQHVFGVIDNNNMILNDKGYIIDNILTDCNNEKCVIKYYQIMPNHIHFIVELLKDGEISLARVVSMIKGKATFLLKTKNIWQKGYYERIVRDDKEYENIIKYIVNNPYRDKYNW